MKRIINVLGAISLVSLLSFLSCDEENIIQNGEQENPVNDEISVTLNIDSLSLYIGETDTLIATVHLENRIVDYNVIWSSDNASVAEVDSNGLVTALSVGVAKISATFQGNIAICNVVVKSPEQPAYEYVDLGLSVKWATCNVGATKPEEYGDYYAWGEIETKSTYDGSTYKWCKGSYTTMTKYCNKSDYGDNGFTDTKTTLDPEDDVAHVKWGGNWRMPTEAEQDELRINCTWTWYSCDNTEFNGVAGYKVTSNVSGYTDRFIFLPAAGYRYDTSLADACTYGGYWSSSLYSDYPYDAHRISFQSGPIFFFDGLRDYGRSVRPVCP